MKQTTFSDVSLFPDREYSFNVFKHLTEKLIADELYNCKLMQSYRFNGAYCHTCVMVYRIRSTIII